MSHDGWDDGGLDDDQSDDVRLGASWIQWSLSQALRDNNTTIVESILRLYLPDLGLPPYRFDLKYMLHASQREEMAGLIMHYVDRTDSTLRHSALRLVIEKGYVNIVKSILRGEDIISMPTKLLNLAASTGHADIMALLLSEGAKDWQACWKGAKFFRRLYYNDHQYRSKLLRFCINY